MITTFGHSTLDEAAGLAFLDSAGVDVLIDVRSHPTSRWEQWRRENLDYWVPLATHGDIRYEWWPDLGGWGVRHAEDTALRDTMVGFGVDLAAYSRGAFPKQRIAADRVASPSPGDPVWTNQGLYDYAWFTTLPEFQGAVDRLIERYGSPDAPTCALMCAEFVWWKCHRSMIADVLTTRGVEVHHIQPRWAAHGATIGNRLQRYPSEVRRHWPDLGLTTRQHS